jgi:glutaredoxin 3
MSNKKVLIYSTPTCHFCHIAKDFFAEKGITYEEYNVATDLAKRQEMVDKSGQMGVPVIDIEGDIIVGFDEEAITSKLGL